MTNSTHECVSVRTLKKNPLKSGMVLTLTSLKPGLYPGSKITEHSTTLHVRGCSCHHLTVFGCLLRILQMVKSIYEKPESNCLASNCSSMVFEPTKYVWGLGEEGCPCLKALNMNGCSFRLLFPSLTKTFLSTKC